MNIEKIIRRVLGKPEFNLSKAIPRSYLFYLAMRNINGLIRGTFFSVGAQHGHMIIMGKGSRLIDRRKIHLGNHVRIGQWTILNAISSDGIWLGNNVKIGASTEIQCTGSLAELGKGLVIGDNSSFSSNSFLGCAGGIEIGHDVIAGQNVRFHSENHAFDDINILIREQGVTHKGISIGSNVWIGAGAVFLDGVIVGDGCVIGANALMTAGEYPRNSVIVGVPARVVRKRGVFNSATYTN